MGTPNTEQETTINFSRDGKSCYVWTSDTTVMTKLDKLCESAPDFYHLENIGSVNGEVVDKEYIITDKSMLSFRTTKRILTDEQKEKARELAKINFKRN